MRRNVIRDTSRFVRCCPAALNPYEHWAKLLMHVAESWAAPSVFHTNYSNYNTWAATNEQKIGPLSCCPLYIWQNLTTEGKIALYSNKAFSTRWFCCLSSQLGVVRSIRLFKVKSCSAVHDKESESVSYIFVRPTSDCFAPISQVLSVWGKPTWRYTVSTCRVFSPGTGPTQYTGARLLLFTLPWCRHGGQSRLYQVRGNHRGSLQRVHLCGFIPVWGKSGTCSHPCPDFMSC